MCFNKITAKLLCIRELLQLDQKTKPFLWCCSLLKMLEEDSEEEIGSSNPPLTLRHVWAQCWIWPSHVEPVSSVSLSEDIKFQQTKTAGLISCMCIPKQNKARAQLWDDHPHPLTLNELPGMVFSHGNLYSSQVMLKQHLMIAYSRPYSW